MEFLDSVLESTRAKEQAVKVETSEQLELFRRQQQEADKGPLEESGDATNTAGSPVDERSETQWAVNARKRKRLKDDKGLKGPKLRKSSSTSEAPPLKSATLESAGADPGDSNSNMSKVAADVGSPGHSKAGVGDRVSSPIANSQRSGSAAPAKSNTLPGLGLSYSSDEE